MSNKQPNFTLPGGKKKRRKNKAKVSSRKDTIKIKVEINKIETRKME